VLLPINLVMRISVALEVPPDLLDGQPGTKATTIPGEVEVIVIYAFKYPSVIPQEAFSHRM